MTEGAIRLFELKDAAAYLGMGKTLFREQVLPHVRPVSVGRKKLYDKLDLDEWVAMRKAGQFASPRVARSGSSASSTKVAPSNDPRAKSIAAELRRELQKSTQKSFQAA